LPLTGILTTLCHYVVNTPLARKCEPGVGSLFMTMSRRHITATLSLTNARWGWFLPFMTMPRRHVAAKSPSTPPLLANAGWGCYDNILLPHHGPHDRHHRLSLTSMSEGVFFSFSFVSFLTNDTPSQVHDALPSRRQHPLARKREPGVVLLPCDDVLSYHHHHPLSHTSTNWG
jgi:hypothetical protein